MKKVNNKIDSNSNEQVIFTIPTDVQKMLNTLPSTSSKIRYLHSLNYSRSNIQKNFNLLTKKGEPIRYQHVRNVLITPIKKQKV